MIHNALRLGNRNLLQRLIEGGHHSGNTLFIFCRELSIMFSIIPIEIEINDDVV